LKTASRKGIQVQILASALRRSADLWMLPKWLAHGPGSLLR
jgi:hypothetical protein